MPAAVDDAVAAFGTRLRMAILRRLTEAGPQTPSELAAHLQVTGRTTLLSNLDALESVGVVTADTPPGQRHGRNVAYTVDPSRLATLTAAVGEYLQLPQL